MLWKALALPLAVMALAGCGGGSGGEETGTPGEVSIDLSAQNDANITGARAILRYVDDDTTLVTVDGLDGAEQPGLGKNPVRIVEGSCERPGRVAFRLPALTDEGSESRVGIGIAAFYERDYAVQVLFSKNGEPYACGDTPDGPPS